MSNTALFDLTPTEDQQMNRTVVRRFAEQEMASVARDADEAAALPEGFLQKTLDLGLNFMPLPEAFGGMGAGRDPVSNALNYEDLGRGDLSMALAAVAPLSLINCVLDAGDESQQSQVAQRLAATTFVPASLAWAEPGIDFAPDRMKTRAVRQADGSFSLSGEKCRVVFGPDCRQLLVFAAVDDGVEAFLLEGTETALQYEVEAHMGLRALPLYTVRFQDLVVPASARLSRGVDVAELLARSRIAVAALAVGVCQSVLDYVVPYVNERVAFGEPISHRQSVAFMVADMATEIEGLRLLVYRAASRAEQGLDCRQPASAAFRNAVKYGMTIGTDGVQLLGGHGFTRSHPVELWYRNLRGVPLLEGLVVA